MAAGERQGAAETRQQILAATEGLLEECGASALSVSLIMSRAGISRTAFYRHFTGVYDVVASVLARIASELAEESGDWFSDPNAIGSPDVIYGNTLRSGRAIKRRAKLMCAITDAAGLDESLRDLWRNGLIQGRIDATASAIRRDQAVVMIDARIDPDATALALTLMSQQVALELLGRQGGDAEDYARIAAPIWEAVLFGTRTDALERQ